MITFILGLVILFVGAALYGKFCEKVFGPDDRKTPAYTKEDGVDYVPMRGLEEQPDQSAEHRGHRPHPRTDPGHPVRTDRVYHDPDRKHYRRSHARLLSPV